MNYFFEVDTLDGEFTTEVEAINYQAACAKLKEQYPELTGWFCPNSED